MKIAIHQPNFCPWLPYFYKMAMADKFVILKEVTFSKEAYQHRYYLNGAGHWVTKPINRKTSGPIKNKEYSDGANLFDLNMQWIYAIKETLSIKTEIVYDFEMEETATDRLVKLIKHYDGDTYITVEDAANKYLEEHKIIDAGIRIEYMRVPKYLKIHTFEAFEQFGIQGTIEQLPNYKKVAKIEEPSAIL